MNISQNTNIQGIEKTGCSVGHIAHCISASSGNFKYSYFGKRVQRGSFEIQTKNGTFPATFVCKDGWLASLTF